MALGSIVVAGAGGRFNEWPSSFSNVVVVVGGGYVGVDFVADFGGEVEEGEGANRKKNNISASCILIAFAKAKFYLLLRIILMKPTHELGSIAFDRELSLI